MAGVPIARRKKVSLVLAIIFLRKFGVEFKRRVVEEVRGGDLMMVQRYGNIKDKDL